MTTKKRTVLVTVNARYSHPSLALRYLKANLEARGSAATLLEFTLNERPQDMLERILELSPNLVAFSVSIWNLQPLTELAGLMKALRPRIPLILGGPEVWFEQASLDICHLADHIVTGEGELVFPDLVAALLAGGRPPRHVIAPPPDLSRVRLPYALYTSRDLSTRLTYVETSRGCPFRCAFCLSSRDHRVRTFPLDTVLAEVASLIQRGARSLKFVDRSINLDAARFQAVLETCLTHYHEGLELHFEVVPVPLSPPVLALLGKFPPGSVQLEVGIQTFSRDVATRVARRFDEEKVVRFFDTLHRETGVHLHSDLIFGLPGETGASFGASFERLLALRPHEIQVGILKRLRGTPLATGPDSDVLRFNPNPPYDVLETDTVPFEEMARVKRFARYFDLFYNRGDFERSIAGVLWPDGATHGSGFRATGAFTRFLEFSDWLFSVTGQTHRMALTRRYHLLFTYLTEVLGHPPRDMGRLLLEDYDRHGVRRERLEFLKPVLGRVGSAPTRSGQAPGRRRGRCQRR